MKRKTVLICCCMFLCVTCGIDTVSSGIVNKLQKAFLYDEKVDSMGPNIDLGRIVLLFSSGNKKVDFSLKRTKGPEKTKDVYFFPMTAFAGAETERMVGEINNIVQTNYNLSIGRVRGDVPGLQLIVVYDHNKVSIEPRAFKTISASPALEFRFHNRGIIDAMKKQFSTTTRVSALKKKPLSLTVGMGDEILVRLVC